MAIKTTQYCKGGVLVFYCCITNYLTRSSPRQHPFIISHFLWVKNVGMAELDSLLRASQGRNQDAGWAAFSSGCSTRGGPTSKLPQIVGRIYFLVAVEFVAVCFFKENNKEKIVSAT